jgi:hypothetical protein
VGRIRGSNQVSTTDTRAVNAVTDPRPCRREIEEFFTAWQRHGLPGFRPEESAAMLEEVADSILRSKLTLDHRQRVP